MNIILVKPCYPYPYSRGEYTYNRIWPPLCLANCAAILEKEGHRVTILDAHAMRIRPGRIGRFIKDYDKVFVTSSSLDKWQCPNIDINPFLETVGGIKKLTEEVYIMGYHGTVEPERILELTGAKAVIIGEPENAVSDICNNGDLGRTEGIYFKDGRAIVSTPKRKPVDLNELPLPAYHLLDFRKYFYEILGRNFALFEISRGCRFLCKHCNKVMYGSGVRAKPAEKILKEVSAAVEEYGVKTGYFIDLDFLSNREAAEELCGYLIKKRYGFSWTCQTRPDFLNKEILKKMKMAGCKLVHIGVESSSQELLENINKHMTFKRVRETVRLCKEEGIRTLAFFIFGLPGETEENREAVFNAVKELDSDYISLHNLIHYKQAASPNSKEQYRPDGIEENSAVPDQDIEKFMRRAYMKYYLRPSYMYRLGPSVALAGFRLLLGRIRSLR